MDLDSTFYKVFYTVAYEGAFHVASPVAPSLFQGNFDETFKITFEQSEQIIFKVLGITKEGTESILGTVKYHV